MGGKSKPTIGYWYDIFLHFGLCRGPIDALLEFRGGEKAAWSGEATGGTVAINARELWGGEKAEGGIEGELDVMLGGADQEPSARLAAVLGDQQSAFRGRATVAFQGLYGAFNPYPKGASWKVRRIFEGWDGGECWYPEKAAVAEGGATGIGAGTWWLTGMGAGSLWIGTDPTDFSTAVAVTRSPNVGAGSHGVRGGGYYRVNASMAMLLEAGNPGQYELIYDGLAVVDTVAPVVGDVPFAATGGAAFNVAVIDGRVFIYSGNFETYYVFDSTTYAPGDPVTWVPHTCPNGWRPRGIAKVGSNLCLHASAGSSGGYFYANAYGNPITWLSAPITLGTWAGNQIHPLGGNVAFSPGPSNTVLRTENGGQSWAQSGDFGADGIYYSNMSCAAHNGAGVVIASDTNATKLARSIDNGLTWASVPGITWGATRIDFVDGRFVASAPGSDGGIFTADASGSSWPATPLPGGVEPGFYTALYMCPVNTVSTLPGRYMNPAHIIYFALTATEMQGEPIATVNDASFRAAADLFYAEGFGLCPRYNPATQTPDDFIARICGIAGATLSRSRVDGQYYLIPRRGVHDLESLPILEDDDILEYEEEPSDPLEAVNQVTVEWFDPVNKQKRTTSPIQALGAIQALGGVVAESLSYPEIPVEGLALRVGGRDLGQKATPLKRFRLTTNRVPYAWRAGDYFRLQAPRRGIADMVCEVGEVDAGTPRSGTMRLVAIQDVSRMPTSVYVEAEPGIDTSPSPIPAVPPAQQLIEAPYVDLAGDLPAGELAALAADAGFVLAVAARPTSGINYTLYTAAAGEDLTDQGTGDWCPTALVVEAGARNPGQTDFTLEQGFDLARVEVGSAALWGDEVVRIDAIDAGALTVTFGRACADTTPGLHAAGERIWFYDAWAASDRREYAGGETVSAKLRTRTSSQLLDATLAPTLSLDLDERAIRPYPPGGLTITDVVTPNAVNPAECFGEITVNWVHRDRLLQADQLVDAAAAGIGPEAGTTYTVRIYLNDVIEETESGISGTSSTPYTPSGNGLVRVEVEANRDGYASWQSAVAEFSYALNTNNTRVTVGGDRRVTVGGDIRVTRG